MYQKCTVKCIIITPLPIGSGSHKITTPPNSIVSENCSDEVRELVPSTNLFTFYIEPLWNVFLVKKQAFLDPLNFQVSTAPIFTINLSKTMMQKSSPIIFINHNLIEGLNEIVILNWSTYHVFYLGLETFFLHYKLLYKTSIGVYANV